MILSLERQVCSLALAKRLKELGVKQDGLFTWIKNFHTNDLWRIGDYVDIGNNNEAIARRLEPWFAIGPSAFTVAELGKMLPDAIEKDAWTYTLQIDKWNDDEVWDVSYINADGALLVDFYEKTEADARAKMLIYLLENKLITI